MTHVCPDCGSRFMEIKIVYDNEVKKCCFHCRRCEYLGPVGTVPTQAIKLFEMEVAKCHGQSKR